MIPICGSMLEIQKRRDLVIDPKYSVGIFLSTDAYEVSDHYKRTFTELPEIYFAGFLIGFRV